MLIPSHWHSRSAMSSCFPRIAGNHELTFDQSYGGERAARLYPILAWLNGADGMPKVNIDKYSFPMSSWNTGTIWYPKCFKWLPHESLFQTSFAIASIWINSKHVFGGLHVTDFGSNALSSAEVADSFHPATHPPWPLQCTSGTRWRTAVQQTLSAQPSSSPSTPDRFLGRKGNWKSGQWREVQLSKLNYSYVLLSHTAHTFHIAFSWHNESLNPEWILNRILFGKDSWSRHRMISNEPLSCSGRNHILGRSRACDWRLALADSGSLELA